MKKSHYLVAVDGSEWGARAAHCAVTLAQKTGAKVTFLTVVPWSGFQPMTLDEISHRPIDKKLEEDIAQKSVLEPLLAIHKDSGVDISSELLWGNPSEAIHARIKKSKAGHVFVGRRGRSRLSDLILGSVANRLAHTVGVPITLVP